MGFFFKKTFFDRLFFFQGSFETQLARSFSWPYVVPPSKSEQQVTIKVQMMMLLKLKL